MGDWLCGEGATEETSITRRAEDVSDDHCVGRKVSKAQKPEVDRETSGLVLARDWSRDLSPMDRRYWLSNSDRSYLQLSKPHLFYISLV